MFLGPFRYGSGSLTQKSALFRVIRGRILNFGVTYVSFQGKDFVSNKGEAIYVNRMTRQEVKVLW
jgi:hypothetical protein